MGIFTSDKKKNLDRGLEKTKESVFKKLSRAVVGKSKVDDEVLETIAVTGERHEIAAKLTARLGGIADSVSLTHNRYPDPRYWADIVDQLKRP